jgi:hypothetical protein
MSDICEANGSLRKVLKTKSKAKSSVILELDLGTITLKLSTRTRCVSYAQLRRLMGKEVSIAYELGTEDSSPTLLGVSHIKRPSRLR